MGYVKVNGDLYTHTNTTACPHAYIILSLEVPQFSPMVDDSHKWMTQSDLYSVLVHVMVYLPNWALHADKWVCICWLHTGSVVSCLRVNYKLITLQIGNLLDHQLSGIAISTNSITRSFSAVQTERGSDKLWQTKTWENPSALFLTRSNPSEEEAVTEVTTHPRAFPVILPKLPAHYILSYT